MKNSLYYINIAVTILAVVFITWIVCVILYGILLNYGFTKAKKFLLKLNNIEFLDSKDILLQKNIADCGTACVANILKQGKKIIIDKNEYGFISKDYGSSLGDISAMLNKFGIEHKIYEFPNELDLYNLNKGLNVLVLINQNYLFSSSTVWLLPFNTFYNYIFSRVSGAVKHWIYIEMFENDHAVFIDPGIGRIKMKFSDLAKFWNKKAILVKA